MPSSVLSILQSFSHRTLIYLNLFTPHNIPVRQVFLLLHYYCYHHQHHVNGENIQGHTGKVNCPRLGIVSRREGSQIQITARGHALIWSFCLAKYFLKAGILKYSRYPLQNTRILAINICLKTNKKPKSPAKNTYKQQFLSRNVCS